MTRWGTIVGPNENPRTRTSRGRIVRDVFSDEDFEWAVKMAYHEAETNLKEQEAVLWTVANRWIGWYGRPGETYGEFVQRFSQPINPRQIGRVLWYDYRAEELRSDREYNLTACQGGGAGTEACALERARARWERIEKVEVDKNRARAFSWYEAHAPRTVELVRRFMTGRLPNRDFPGWTDFAAGFVPGDEGERVTYPGFSDSFYRDSWAKNWTTDTVKIEPPEGTKGRFRAWPILVAPLLVGTVVIASRGLGRRS